MDDNYDDYRIVGSADIGEVLLVTSKDHMGLRTVMRHHKNGFSITHFRRHFRHLAGREIKGSSTWKMVRHQEWIITKSVDVIDPAYQDVEPSEPIKGDVDD